jgi:hypothetical protein
MQSLRRLIIQANEPVDRLTRGRYALERAFDAVDRRAKHGNGLLEKRRQAGAQT